MFKTISQLPVTVFAFLTITKMRVLPRPLAMFIGRSIGVIACWLRIRRKVAEENIKRVFPEMSAKDRERLIYKLCINLFEFMTELIRFDMDYKKDLVVEGVERIHQAAKAGKGGLIVLGHLGNWELMGRYFATLPYKCHVVAKPMKNKYVERVLKKQRNQAKLNVIYQKHAVQDIIAALKGNEFTGLLIDQDVGRAGVFPEFLGAPASTAPTVASLALKYQCAVLSVHMLKREGGGYKFLVSEAFPLIKTGDRPEEVLKNTQAYNDYIGDLIRQYPDQWFGWFHRRWKTRPNMTRN